MGMPLFRRRARWATLNDELEWTRGRGGRGSAPLAPRVTRVVPWAAPTPAGELFTTQNRCDVTCICIYESNMCFI